jgi:very-short-patch-repair endonuclease
VLRVMDGMRPQLANVHRLVAQVAARQHGVVTFAQLVGLGIHPRTISRWVAAGKLHRIYRGVYAVGHARLSSEGRWLAAVFACGDGSVLSHRSAAELWRMLPAITTPIHVTVRGSGGRTRRRGLVIHHSSALQSTDTLRRNGIAVTKPARTLADLRRIEQPAVVRRAKRQAAYLGLDFGSEGGEVRERSDLERRMLWVCRRHRLPIPEVNVPIGPFTVDFLWRERRLVVETDGWEAHRGRQAFEDDRARDAYLRLRGYEVLRFSWRQLFDDPQPVVAVLRRYLT